MEATTDADAVRIVLNGEETPIERGSRVSDLVLGLGRDPRTVAVEHNGEILPRARYGEVELSPGDRVEIVHFVQGG